jgi:dTDP-4-dehydrorhamnose reductase
MAERAPAGSLSKASGTNISAGSSESILILGGNGMLAHALARRAAIRGIQTVLLPRDQCDVRQPEQIETAFRVHHPTVVVNCAAYTKVDAAETETDLANAINGQAVESLLAIAGNVGARFVHFGSDFVFDGSSQRPYRENDPAHLLSAYGRSKYAGEATLLAHPNQNWLLLRTAWLYGRNGVCFPRTMVELARKGVPLSIVNDQIGSPTLTDDLADATFDLLAQNAAGLFHVVNSGAASWFDFAVATLEAFNISHPVAPISTAEWRAKRPGQAIRPAYSVLDTMAVADKLRRPMRPWRDALADFRSQVDTAGGFA